LHYCSHSANPVGRLVLYVFNNATERTIEFSDKICTALQLANFWQDVAVDWRKGRVYIPLEDMKRFGYTEADLEMQIVDERFRDLLAFQVERTRELFIAGKPLLHKATPELRLELNLTWRGGMKILQKIETSGYDVLHKRPAISMTDKLGIFFTSLLRLA
ncbi:MAG: squalene/phytoene synthase family protein, partial [Bacteroidota bacterium]